MPIYEQDGKRVLFIHIPKTGGMSIEKWLGDKVNTQFYSPMKPGGLMVSPQHLQISDFKILFGDAWWQWAFAVVRNPYDRLESEYFYRVRQRPDLLGSLPDFSSWVVYSIRQTMNNPFYYDNHIRPQTDFIDSDMEVFRLEDGLENVARAVASRLSIDVPTDIGRINTSYRGVVKWSVEATNLANSFYMSDFNLLGYSQKIAALNIHGNRSGS